MDPVEEERQARRAKEWAQRDLPNITLASVLNRERERRRERWQSKFYLTSAHVPQNLEDAILDLHRYQLAQLSYDGKYPLNNIISFIFYIITNFLLLNSCCLLL